MTALTAVVARRANAWRALRRSRIRTSPRSPAGTEKRALPRVRPPTAAAPFGATSARRPVHGAGADPGHASAIRAVPRVTEPTRLRRTLVGRTAEPPPAGRPITPNVPGDPAAPTDPAAPVAPLPLGLPELATCTARCASLAFPSLSTARTVTG